LAPGSSDYFTCIQNMKLVTNKFKSGGLHEKHVVATWNLETISAFDYRHREATQNLCRRKTCVAVYGKPQRSIQLILWRCKDYVRTLNKEILMIYL